jgi:Family of unknown function (DUF5641)
MVIITDDNVPRNTWPLGRAIEALQDPTILIVKSVVVKTRSAVLNRPVPKLCLLEPVNTEDSSR